MPGCPGGGLGAASGGSADSAGPGRAAPAGWRGCRAGLRACTCLSRCVPRRPWRGSMPIPEGVQACLRRGPEHLGGQAEHPGSPRVGLSLRQRPVGRSGQAYPRAAREGVGDRAGYAADRRGLCAGLARREVFGLASPSFVLAGTARHGRRGRGGCRPGFCTGRPGLWGGWLGRRGCRERLRRCQACRAHRPGRRGRWRGWRGARPGAAPGRRHGRRTPAAHATIAPAPRRPGCFPFRARILQGPPLETAKAAETRPYG